jgi:hypothetical protein
VSLRLTWRWVRVGEIALLIAATVASAGVTGVLRAAPEARVIGAHVEVDQHLYRSTVLGAVAKPERYVGWDLDKDRVVDEIRLRIEITLRVTNTSDRFKYVRSLLESDPFMAGFAVGWPEGVRPVSAAGRAEVVDADAPSQLLQPHRPATLRVSFQLPTGTPTPKRLTVGLADFTYSKEAMLDPRGYWGVVEEDFRSVPDIDPATGKVRRDPRTGEPLAKLEGTPKTIAEVRVPVTPKGNR